MTEITRVPLQPIKKGSLTKLWIAIVVLAVAALALASLTAPRGVVVETVTEGSGPVAEVGDVVFANYVGKLDDGTEFDASEGTPPGIPPGIFPEGVPFVLEEGATIPGFFESLQKVQNGGSYVFRIPADKAYGDDPPPDSAIPANADLTFEITVNGVMSQEEFQQRVGLLQQMMQQAPPPGAEEGGAGADAAEPAPPGGS